MAREYERSLSVIEFSGAFFYVNRPKLIIVRSVYKKTTVGCYCAVPCVRSVSDSNRESLSFNEEVYLHRLSIVFLSKFSTTLRWDSWFTLTTDLMLYDATLRSTPRPDRLPSKSAARLSSISSSLQPATRLLIEVEWKCRSPKKWSKNQI